MAYSYVDLPGDGSTTNFNFTFGYLSRSHVSVKVNLVDTAFTWVTDFSIQITPAPANGAIVEIRRTTPLDQPAVVWSDGATLTEADMNLDTRFNLYANQEAHDAVADAVTKNPVGVWDGQGRKTTNFADPTDMTGLVTRNYFENTYTPELDQKVADAAASAANSASSASASASSASAASTSASSALNYLNQFRGQYLGAQATSPTVDGNGAPVSAGDLYFNTTENTMKVYTGVAWQNAGSTIQGTINKPNSPVIATAGQTVVPVPNGFDSNYILVFVNGVEINTPDIDVSSGANIVFATGLNAGDEVMWVAFGSFNAANAIPADGSVTTSKIADGAVNGTKIADGSVSDSEIATDSLLYTHTHAWVGSKDHGAVGNGTTNDTSAILASNNEAQTYGKELVFTFGNYRIASNITFTAPVRFLPGAFLTVDTGVTVTFGDQFKAPIKQVFILNGTAQVTFAPSANSVGYPEWWGAQPNNSAADCTPAINKCIVALPITRLQAADYYCATTPQINTNARTLEGVMRVVNDLGTGKASKILIKSSTLDVLFVGLASNPGSVNSFLRSTAIRNVQFQRTVAPTPPASGSEINGPAGIRFQYTLFTDVENVDVLEHSIGYVLNGTVRTNFKDCTSFRSVNGTSSTNDIYWGWMQNGYASIGLAGGNASTYYSRCSASIGGTPTLTAPRGLVLSGPPVDTFIDRFEVSSIPVGIEVAGGGTQSGDADLHIRMPIIDQYSQFGIYIHNMGAYGAVEIEGGYGAPSSSANSGSAFINIDTCQGQISIGGGQAINWTQPEAMGLRVNSSNGVVVDDRFKVKNSKRPVVITSSGSVKFLGIIDNEAVISGTQAAVYVDGSHHVIAEPMIKGATGSFPQGVWFNSTTVINSKIEVSGINPGCIVGGASNKAVYNGSQLAAEGTFGTANIIRGTFG